MTSLVHAQRDQLAALGEYVVLANIASGWFAIFESTLLAQTRIATSFGRPSPNLIVYRTRDERSEPRDHYVVPYSIFRALVTEETVAVAKVKSSRRWNLTLKDGHLRVTHGAGSVDVTSCYRAPLLTESATELAHAKTPLSRPDFQTTQALEGLAKEYRAITRRRSASLREAALNGSCGTCEACGIDFSSVLGGLGASVLQVHHKNQLAHAETEVVTTLKDIAVLCANCHSLVHALPGSPMPVEDLWALWRRGLDDA